MSALWLPAVVGACVAVAAAAQVLSGLGFTLIAGPLLILAFGHLDGVRVSVALSLVLNAFVLAGSYRHARWGDALRLLLPAALLVPPTLLVTARLDHTVVTGAAGAAVLLGCVLIASGRRARWVDGPTGAIAAGAGSGILNVLAGASGPPVALFVAHRGWPTRVGTATLQAYALPLNVVTLAALGAPAARPSHLLWAGGGLLLGTAAAWPFTDRLSPVAVRRLVLALAALGGLVLIGRALD